MTDLQTFGPFVTRTRVLDTVERMLAAWADEYMALVERDMGLEVRSSLRPVHFPRRVDVRTIPGDQLPCWVLVSEGYASTPIAGADGDQTAGWSVDVVAIVAGGGGLITDLDRLLDVHLTAISVLMSNQPFMAASAADAPILGVHILDRSDNAIPALRQRNLIGGVLELLVTTEDTARYRHGPTGPPRSDPTPPYPPLPTIEHTSLTVDTDPDEET